MIYDHKSGLMLRKLDKEHLDSVLHAKFDSWTTQHRTSVLNIQDQQKWFESIGPNDYHLIAYSYEDQTRGEWSVEVGLVSVTGIDWISRTARVGMMAMGDQRGTARTKHLPAVATDFAFEVLNLRRLEAEVLDNNPAALKFDLDVGYQVEGRKKQAVCKNGFYHDSLMIAMLRSDWEVSPRVQAYGGICNENYKRRGPIERVLDRHARKVQ